MMIGELVTLSEKSGTGFKMFTLPSHQHMLSYSPPTSVRVTLVKICGSASGNREKEQHYFGPISTKCRLQTGD